MRIAIFDYFVTKTTPIGSCHLKLLEGLSKEHEFVVFSMEFENPDPSRIEFVRIPAPRRPAVARQPMFHALGPHALHSYLRRGGAPFDLIQTVETNVGFGDLCYAHFCHRVFVRDHWKSFSHEYRGAGLRRSGVWLAHKISAGHERAMYRRVPRVVVPSAGLARELRREYPATATKTRILPNAIDAERMKMPGDFDRRGQRDKHGFSDDDLVFTFVALGHFERKGLPLVLEALASIDDPRLKLLVVGGEFDVVWDYKSRAKKLGLEKRVVLAGKQRDVRPYLWCSDAFVLPSCYEVFPLVVLEAAAAEVPIIVSQMNGVEDFLVDGQNGIHVERTAEGVAAGIRRFVAMPQADRLRLGHNGSKAVGAFGLSQFIDGWRDVYAEVEAGKMRATAATS